MLLLSDVAISKDTICIDSVKKDGDVMDVRVSVDEILKASLWVPQKTLPISIKKLVSSTIVHLSEKNNIIVIDKVELSRDELQHDGQDVFFWYYKIHYSKIDHVKYNESKGVVYRLLNGKFINY